MTDYQKMYSTLFNAITDAVESIRQGRCGEAEALLTTAQQETEELYICAETDLPEGEPSGKRALPLPCRRLFSAVFSLQPLKSAIFPV